MENKVVIGFIGQGFIGKNYANDLEHRGFSVVRYALEAPYIENKEKIKECNLVFIAVPTPTTPKGFDASIVKNAITLTSPGTIIIIKSTILPGMTQEFQEIFNDRVILFSPEFLREKTAAEDAANPKRNIIGIPKKTKIYQDAAERVMSILPKAPYQIITDSLSAEFLKYISNSLPYTKIIFLNAMYDLVEAKGGDWNSLRDLLKNDPYIAPDHLDPVHKTGRGAGGHCLIKDFAAIRWFYENTVKDKGGVDFLRAIEERNKELLLKSKKDLDLLQMVYGE